jgi:hypothetical protein
MMASLHNVWKLILINNLFCSKPLIVFGFLFNCKHFSRKMRDEEEETVNTNDLLMVAEHPEWSRGSKTNVTLRAMVCQVLSEVATPDLRLEHVCKLF